MTNLADELFATVRAATSVLYPEARIPETAMPKWTPGPWDYVSGTEHHGPYVTTQFGSTICDCYTMTLPMEPSVRNGGPSRPLPFMSEMANPNARLIAAAPELYEALVAAQEELRLIRMKDTASVCNPALSTQISVTLAKARGEP